MDRPSPGGGKSGSVSEDSRLLRWIRAEPDHRHVAATVDPDAPESFYRSYVPADAFDGTAFVREASSTTPL